MTPLSEGLRGLLRSGRMGETFFAIKASKKGGDISFSKAISLKQPQKTKLQVFLESRSLNLMTLPLCGGMFI